MRYHHFYEIPDLPIDAFKHIGDRKIRPQGGGSIPVVSDVIDGAGDLINQGAKAVETQVVAPVANAIDNTIKGIEQDPLGSAAKIATAIYAPAYLPAVVAADAVAKGAPLDKALEQAAITYAGQTAGSYVNSAVDSAGAANTYDTNLGSQQSNMLAAQESGMGTAGDVAGNVAGSAASSIVRGQDALTALKNSGVSAGTTAVTAEIPGFSDLSPSAQKAVNVVVASTLQGGDPSQALVTSAINSGIAEARNQVNAPPAGALPGGTQVASTDGGLPTVSVSGSPIYAESSTANTVKAPFGFDLMPATLSDQRPEGAYYDQFQNAWFMPNQDAQNLQTQLQNQTTSDPLTAQEAPSGDVNVTNAPTGGLPTAPVVDAATSTVTPSTLDTVAQTNQAALNAAIQSNNPDLVSAVVNNNTPVITALAGGDVTTATNLVGGSSNVPAPPEVNQNQTAVSDTKPPVSEIPEIVVTAPRPDPYTGDIQLDLSGSPTTTGVSGTGQQTTGPLTNLASTPVQTSSSSVLPTAAAAAAAAAGANQMGTTGTSDVQLDYTPHFVKGSQINLVGAPTFEPTYITPQQMQMQAPSPYTPGMMGYAEGSSVSMQPQFTRGRAQFLQGLMTPMTRPQVGHMQFQRHSEGHSVDGGEHVPEFYSEGGLKSIDHTYVTGDGDGTSDSIPAMLANGEFVIPADVVASLGNGSNESGASVLDQFMKAIREHKRDAHPDHLPPDSKGPLAYLQEAQKKVK